MFVHQRRYFLPLLVMTVLFTAAPQASLPKFGAGPVFELDFYGQPGLYAECHSPQVLGDHLQVRLQYTTSRLSFWHGKYALLVDNGYLGTAWHFRPSKLFDPYAGIDIGASHFDDEGMEELDNNFFRLNLRTGMLFTCCNGRIRPFIDGGYNILTSSVTYQFFFACGVAYTFLNGGNR